MVQAACLIVDEHHISYAVVSHRTQVVTRQGIAVDQKFAGDKRAPRADQSSVDVGVIYIIPPDHQKIGAIEGRRTVLTGGTTDLQFSSKQLSPGRNQLTINVVTFLLARSS